MENAVDALKMAFAVLVFIVALAIVFSIIGTAVKTSNVVLYHTDKTNFYEASKSSDQNRTVGAEQIVSTLYRILEGETITVSVKLKSGVSFNNIGYTANNSLNKNDIINFIEKNYNNLKGKKFTEEFVEVNYDGMYREAADGSRITIVDGGTRIYITYTEK